MLNLDDKPPIEYLNLDTPWPSQNLSPEAIDNKAQRAAYGMQPLLNYPTIKSYLDDGAEKDLRVNAASQINQKWRAEDADSLRKGETPALKSIPPSAVLEDQLGERFVKNFNETPGDDSEDDDGTYARIRRNYPELTAAALIASKQHVALRDALYNHLQNAVGAAEADKSTTGQVTSFKEDWNILKDMLNVTNLYTERGVIPGTFWQGGFLGGNKEAQRKALLDLPYPENIETLSKVIPPLIEADPRAAIDLLSYLYQPSVLDQTRSNAFDLFNISTILPAGKGLGEAAKSWAELRRMSAEATTRHASAATGDIEAEALDAVGKTREAGEQRATKAVIKRLQGSADPKEEMEAGMLSVFKTRIDEMHKAGPGNAGADVLNRVTEAMDNGSKDLVTLSANAARVLRIDPNVASEIVVKNAYKEMVEGHPWLYDEVANLTSMKPADALKHFDYEPHTQTWSTDLILHNRDGSPFSSVDKARDYANAKGIPITSVHGVPLNSKELRPGGAIRKYEGEVRHPGQTKTLGDLLAEAAKDPSLSYKTKEGLERLGSIAAGEPVETTKVGKYTAYRPANGVYGQGRGFYIAVRVPLTETSKLWRDAVMQTPASLTKNEGWLNSWGFTKYARTPDEVLSQQIMTNRKLAMYAPALFFRAVSKYLEPAALAKSPLRGRNWKQVVDNFGKNSAFERMLKNTQKAQIDFKSIPEMEDYYQRAEGRFPDHAEIEGYFALKFGQDVDKAFRDLAVTKHMSRLGGERHTIHITDENGKRVESPEFIGMVQKEVPGLIKSVEPEGLKPGKAKWANKDVDLPIEILDEVPNKGPDGRLYQKVKYSGKESYVPLDEIKGGVAKSADKTISIGDGRVLIQDGNSFKSLLLKNMTSKENQELLSKVKIGEQRMIQLYNADLFPLREFSGEQRMVQYLITDKTTTRPLGYFKLPSKEAGHLEYDSKHWIRQPKISVDGDIEHYLGDTTIAAVQERAFGNTMTKGLNEVRKNLFKGDKDGIAAAKRAVYENHIPIEWREIRRKFKSKEWNINQEFLVTPNGKTTLDVPNNFDKRPGFKDASRGSSPSRQFQVDFTGERDAYDVMAFNWKGTRNNPEYTFGRADPVDAWSSMNRAMQRIIKSTYMDDVKITSVQDWLSRYADKLDIDHPDDAFKNPWYTFSNANLKKGIGGLEKSSIEAERYQIKSFLGIPSWWDTQVSSIEQRMADAVFMANTKTGQRAQMLAKWTFDTGVKAPDFLRAVAYRAAIGFFAPAQLLVQAMTYASIFGIAGFKRAGQGTLGAMLHGISTMPGVTNNVIKYLDKMAVKLGHFRPGEWLEARAAYNNAGFGYVGHQTNTMRAYASPTKLFSSAFGRVLDAGELFFNLGEQATRAGAWYSAYAEHRALNPTGRLTLGDRNFILNRADDLSGNMTQASRSGLQSGALAFPTQFLGFYMRTFEQFTGSRLTAMQKARMFGVYAAMFGLPVASQITPLILFTESLNKAAQQATGYVPFEVHEDVSKNLIQLMGDLAAYGAPTVGIKKATGQALNIGTRYGPGPGQGFDFLGSDKTFWSLFAGPLGDMLSQTYKNIQPFWYVGSNFIQGKEVPQLTSDDWVQPFKTISSVNAAWKLDMALEYGVWYSRNGNPLAKDVDPMWAAIFAATGLQPLDVDRMALFRSIDKDRDSREEAIEALVKTEMGRFFREVKNNNSDEAATHYKNAEVYMKGYPLTQRDTLWSIIASENQDTLPNREMWNHYLGKHVPEGEEMKGMQQYGRELNAQDNK